VSSRWPWCCLDFDLSRVQHLTAFLDFTDNDDMFLVVASDGVWDTMSSDLVAKFVLVNTCTIVQKKLHVDKKLLRWIARQVSYCHVLE
jgi:serine/threonine protein phosphatase PrpC